jgi:aminoglycoside phosphotransferase family enzyme
MSDVVDIAVEPTLAEKIAFLSTPGSYGGVHAVEAIETHRSWVFLTDQHAWKLKKPDKGTDFDFRTLETRRQNSLAEVRLNRRLAAGVYLGMVPLTLRSPGQLELNGHGPVVDWLVKMRRLHRSESLEAKISTGSATREAAERTAKFLASFYTNARPIPLTLDDYQQRLADTVDDNRTELMRLAPVSLHSDILRVVESQSQFVESQGTLLGSRLQSRRIVEGHGDLRPDHIWLSDPPLIIDCLEFNERLRTLDSASELMFLVLECDRLSAAWIGEIFFQAYSSIARDNPPKPLLEFYRSMHACSRAKLALWHLLDRRGEPEHWQAKAARYLELTREPCGAQGGA